MNSIAYFKRHQRDNIFHYYKVVGGPGKTLEGFQEIINFLNLKPMIIVEHNCISGQMGLTGTWCTFEVGIPISEVEYNAAFSKATENEFEIR